MFESHQGGFGVGFSLFVNKGRDLNLLFLLKKKCSTLEIDSKKNYGSNTSKVQNRKYKILSIFPWKRSQTKYTILEIVLNGNFFHGKTKMQWEVGFWSPKEKRKIRLKEVVP